MTSKQKIEFDDLTSHSVNHCHLGVVCHSHLGVVVCVVVVVGGGVVGGGLGGGAMGVVVGIGEGRINNVGGSVTIGIGASTITTGVIAGISQTTFLISSQFPSSHILSAHCR